MNGVIVGVAWAALFVALVMLAVLRMRDESERCRWRRWYS